MIYRKKNGHKPNVCLRKKPKQLEVNGKSGSITLEDADFGLPEIVVKKKPYVYVQTYYRMLYYDDSLGVAYYRAGLTDNVIERAKKKLSANTNHTSKAKYKNRQNSDYYIYRIDEKGNYLPEDFVMMQDITNYDKEEKDGKLVHTVMILQVFTTDRAYVDKEELKKLKKENKMKMNSPIVKKNKIMAAKPKKCRGEKFFFVLL